MAAINASATGFIDAPAKIVYDIIADYRSGHPRILPPNYFGKLDVLSGGRGAGTKIRFVVKLPFRRRVVAAEIVEPRPGAELRETLADGTATTFLVDEVTPAQTQVTIQTTLQRGGLTGWLAAVLLPAWLKVVYTAQLSLLAKEAKARWAAQSPSAV